MHDISWCSCKNWFLWNNKKVYAWLTWGPFSDSKKGGIPKLKPKLQNLKFEFHHPSMYVPMWKGGRNLELVWRKPARSTRQPRGCHAEHVAHRHFLFLLCFASSCIFCVKVGVAYFSLVLVILRRLLLLLLLLQPMMRQHQRCPFLGLPTPLEFSNASAVTTSTSDGPVAAEP